MLDKIYKRLLEKQADIAAFSPGGYLDINLYHPIEPGNINIQYGMGNYHLVCFVMEGLDKGVQEWLINKKPKNNCRH